MAEVAKLIAAYEAETSNFERGNKRVQQGISQTETNLNRAGRSAQSFWSNVASNSVANLASSLFFRLANSIKTVITSSIQTAASFDAMQRGLTAITGSASLANEQLVRLREIAKLPGIGFQEAVQGSIRLQAVGFSAAQAERALKTFSNAIAFTGGGREELERITVQLGQMSGKGKIVAQDLRPIIESAPAVGRALKEAFGTVDSEQLSKLGLTTQQFIDKLETQLEKLPPAANGVKNAMENFGDSVKVAFATIGKPLLEPLAQALDTITPQLQVVAQNISQFIGDIPQMASGLISSLPESFKNAFGIILDIVQSVGASIVGWFTENLPLIKQTVTTILTAIGTFWATWGGTIKTIVQTAMNAVLAVIKIVMQVINGDWTGAWNTLKTVVINILNNLPAIIKGALGFAIQAALALGKGIIKGIWSGILALPGLVIDAIKSVLAGAWSLATWIYDQAIALGKAIVNGIVAGIFSIGSAIGDAVSSKLKGAIEASKATLQAKSPSKVFIEIGKSIPQGLAVGIVSGIGLVEQSMQKLLNATIQKFSTRQRVVGTSAIDDAQKAIADALAKQAGILQDLAGGETALEAINKLLANPSVAAIVDARTQALLRFNAALEDTLKLTRERVVGLPADMRATGEETRERSIGIPIDSRSDPSAGRARRVMADTVAIARAHADEIADDLTSIIGGAFRDLLDRGWRGFLQGMLDTAKSIFAQIADELIGQLMRGMLGGNKQGKAGGILGILTGAIGSIFGGIGGGSTTSPSGVAVPNWVFKGGFAGGGYLKPGQWGMAGEEGPEPIFAGAGGLSVVPHGKGGTVVNNHYTINVPVARSSGYSQPKSRRQIAEDIFRKLR